MHILSTMCGILMSSKLYNRSVMPSSNRDQLPESPGTNTAAALIQLTSYLFREEQGDQSNVMKVAVVLTDGQSTIDQGNII